MEIYPHAVKRRTVKEYATKYGPKVFIESGTYYGEMIDFVLRKNLFEEIWSIELSKSLWEKALKKYKDHDHVRVLIGNSGEFIPSLIQSIKRPILFWLDGHWSGGKSAKGDKDTPIREELIAIVSHHVDNHVILIDDARFFVGENGYPTIDEVKKIVGSKYKNIVVKDDIIRITN